MNYYEALTIDLIVAENTINERYEECLKDKNYIFTDFELASFRLCLESQELRRQNNILKKEKEETLENKEEVLEKAIDLISKHLTSEILNNYALKLERNNSDDYNYILEEAINLMASQLTTPVNDIDFVKDYYIKEAKKKITKEK